MPQARAMVCLSYAIVETVEPLDVLVVVVDVDVV
jgi:hypothetical protein